MMRQPTPEDLERIGLALHGEGWITPLARDLGVPEQDLRDWLAGAAIPEAKVVELHALLRRRHHEIGQMMLRLGLEADAGDVRQYVEERQRSIRAGARTAPKRFSL